MLPECETLSAYEKAWWVLERIKRDEGFMDPGRRNDDTVNLLICCNVVGEDPDKFLYDDCRIPREGTYFSMYEDHRDRIEPYLSKWEEDGEGGLSYMIRCDYNEEVM